MRGGPTSELDQGENQSPGQIDVQKLNKGITSCKRFLIAKVMEISVCINMSLSREKNKTKSPKRMMKNSKFQKIKKYLEKLSKTKDRAIE